MIDFEHEKDRLNNLMEEAFGTRPLVNGMLTRDFWAWTTRLHIHWIERLKAAEARMAPIRNGE